MGSNKFYSGGFLFNPETNSVLLHKRDAKAPVNPNTWAFFGGLNEGDETPKETFIREISEELGIKLNDREIISLCSYFNEELQTHRNVFYVESDMAKSEMRLGEGEDFDWVPVSKLSEYNLTDKTRGDLAFFFSSRV